MKWKLAAFLAAIVMLTAIAIPASAREVVYYYFTLYETNETDQTGCFDWANGYLVKATSYRDAAIRVDTNSGNYSVRTTINANQYTRATDWAWIDAGGRATPSYLSGHGIQGSPYILWVRRNAAESAYSTAISGSWSPDEYWVVHNEVTHIKARLNMRYPCFYMIVYKQNGKDMRNRELCSAGWRYG